MKENRMIPHENIGNSPIMNRKSQSLLFACFRCWEENAGTILIKIKAIPYKIVSLDTEKRTQAWFQFHLEAFTIFCGYPCGPLLFSVLEDKATRIGHQARKAEAG